MVEIHNGALDVANILKAWYEEDAKRNCGAFIPFVGTVRDEDDIDGLSFDIYEPILATWYEEWKDRAAKKGAFIKMAHSKGDVKLHESSYIAAVFSPKRKVALELIVDFVEDFKANAPIWKYDLKNGKRVYAQDRSHKLQGSGLLK